MKSKSIRYTSLLILAVGCLITASPARAEMLNLPATSSVSSVPSASLYTTASASDPMMLASANYSDGLASLLTDEGNGTLALAALPKATLLNKTKPSTRLELDKGIAATDIDARLAANNEQRAGFSLNGLFRSRDDSSLVSWFLAMAFVGIVIAGVRLEILRRRAEQAAFYGTELASHRRRARHRSTVIYVETPTRASRSSGRSRRRSSSSHSRRRSSRSDTHRSERSSHESTHPIIIESRLAS